MFILLGVSQHNAYPLLLLCGLALGLARISRIPLRFYMLRSWIFIPVFALLIAIPSLFSVVTPGTPLIHIGPLLITRQGLFGATIFVLRVLNSVSYAVLLNLTTPHSRLMKALATFRIPDIFIMTLSMSYRYIYLLSEIIGNTFTAIKSRVGFTIARADGQRLVTWNIASLWQRSYQMNEEVYHAMRSRGYNGHPVIDHDFSLSRQDWWWLSFSTLCFVVIIYTNLK